MVKIVSALLIFALIFQLGLECGSVRAAAANDRNCCTTKCPAQPAHHAADCCQVSMSPEMALAGVAHPAATQISEITASSVSAAKLAPPLLASLAYSPRLSSAPPPPLIDVLCSRQI